MRNIARAVCLLLALMIAAAGAEAALPDGEYAPDGFSFSGGSGRVEITCPRVMVSGGAAVADLAFSSPNYTRLVLDGTEYAAEHDGDTTRFRVPAPLNADFTVVATTTAMSALHDVEYALHIHLDAAGTDAGWAPEVEIEAPAPVVCAALAAREIPGLEWQRTMPLKYAREFSVDYYAGGWKLLTVSGSERYLLAPEGEDPPEGLDPEIRVIRRPVKNIYLAATAAMSLFDALGALDAVTLSSLREADWTVAAAAEAMARGDMRYAGKYSAPDYELLVDSGCGLAVESTMILHTPKVREMIERLGIPVFVEHSAYESHPLGRAEWIRLYGALLDREEQAAAFFDRQAAAVEALSGFPNTEKKVAFFYLSTDGRAVVRAPGDYIPRMIELAGGRYAFREGDLPGGRASVSVTMEAFFAAAADADALIYNGSIDDPLDSVGALIQKNPLFADFRAVREGNVWTTDRSLYQAAADTGEFILDLHRVLNGETGELRFIKRVRNTDP